jgi:hypothetical protein
MVCRRHGGRLGEWYPELDSGASTRTAFDPAPSSGEQSAFPHQHQAEVARTSFDVSGVVAYAVIDHSDQAPVLDFVKFDRDGIGSGMLAYVNQGFPDYPVDEQGGAAGDENTPLVVEPVGDTGVSVHLLEAHPQGCAKAAVFQTGWPEAEAKQAQLVQ